MPFLLFFPFKFDPGIVVRTRSQGVDVWPTIFELIGLESLEDSDGISRVPEILAASRGENLPDSTTTGFAFLDENWGRQSRPARHRLAVTEGPYRFVVRSSVEGVETSEPIEELFNAETDPSELANLAETEPEVVDRLRKAGDEWLTLEPTWGEAPTREINELELNQLRALGYAIP